MAEPRMEKKPKGYNLLLKHRDFIKKKLEKGLVLTDVAHELRKHLMTLDIKDRFNFDNSILTQLVNDDEELKNLLTRNRDSVDRSIQEWVDVFEEERRNDPDITIKEIAAKYRTSTDKILSTQLVSKNRRKKK